MSLSHIILPDIVIADLYPKSLIQHEGPMVGATTARPVETAVNNTAATQPAATPTVAAPVSQPAAVQPQAPVNEPMVYRTLGNNKRQIAIVVNCPNEVFLPETDLQFLTKMLSACKLNMADVAIVNFAARAVAIDPLKQQLQPRHVLLFGVEPGAIQLPISFPAFKEQAYAGSTFLFTPSLTQLNQETEQAKLLKRQLWDCLKRMFL
jgi:hypothetical protein